MFINFIAINDKVLNLNAVALIEDVSTDDALSVLVTTTAGDELTFDDDDAHVILDRCEFLIGITDNLTAQANNAAAAIQNNQV